MQVELHGGAHKKHTYLLKQKHTNIYFCIYAYIHIRISKGQLYQHANKSHAVASSHRARAAGGNRQIVGRERLSA